MHHRTATLKKKAKVKTFSLFERLAKATTLSLLNLIQMCKRFHICRHPQPAAAQEKPVIRMVLCDLTIFYRGERLSVAHLPGVNIGGKVAIYAGSTGLALVPLI